MRRSESRTGRMPRPTRRQLRRPDVRLTLAVVLALAAAMLPLLRVVAPGGWTVAAVAMTTAVLGTGMLLRRLGAPAVLATLAEAVVWAMMLTLMFFADTAVLGIVPTPATFDSLPRVAASATDQIVFGIAPLQAEPALSAIIVGAVGALAILLDHTVITARMPLLAVVALVAVWLIPALAVPAPIDVVLFATLAAALLLLIRTETRSRGRAMQRALGDDASRRSPADPPAPSTRGGAVVAATIAVAAIVATIVVAPELPRPAPRVGVGTGPATTINANLELGDDLRRPTEVDVLTVRTNGTTPPYLRAATLSRFDGQVWEPDRDGTVPLTPDALGPVSADQDVRVTEYSTVVDILQLTTTWLPTPGPAVRVDGLTGEWDAMPSNRTVVAAQGDTQGQVYTTVSQVVRPTLEQIQGTDAGGEGLDESVTALPSEMPAVIAETAFDVTRDQANDFDRLIALQRWFRGSEFSYSLEAPVEDGFDGSGVDAIADFLEVREGYCVHFASAFSLMARSLGMPSRIVIGYLPGRITGDVVEGQSVASVSSSQLHAWPEVHFAGIGWVPFEPTNSLGVPATYPRATQPRPSDGGQDVTPAPVPRPSASLAPEQTAAPTPSATARPGAPDGAVSWDAALPVAGVVVLSLLVLLLPAIAGVVRRRLQHRAARRGDVVAAWRIVRDTALDLGIEVSPADTPRGLGSRLLVRPGVSAEPLQALIASVERAGYGRPATRAERSSTRGSTAQRESGATAAGHAAVVRRELLGGASGARRSLALVLPRSLFAALARR